MEIKKSLNGLKGIYKLTLATHTYVGSSKNIYRRLRQHKYQLMNNKHDNVHMQRVWNKYQPEFIYQILEVCPKELSKKELLKLEHHYIISEKPDLNNKLDPETELRCLTTIKKVYQFDLFGNFIKEWNSLTDAAEYYNIGNSNLTKVCSGVQDSSAGYLWSYSQNYTGRIIGIYVYDLQGTLIDSCSSTIEIYEKYFPGKSRKTVLSQIKSKIDSNSPYCHLYFSHLKNFKVPRKDYWYKEMDVKEFFAKDFTVIKLDEFGKVLTKRKLSEYKGSRLKKDIMKNPEKYSINNDIITFTFVSSRTKKLTAIKDEKTMHFSSISELIKVLFNGDKKLKVAIQHHIERKTPFKGWLITRDCC